MNHPGMIFSVLWLSLLCVSPSVLDWARSSSGSATSGYVCPPCGCGGHELVYEDPGSCTFCDMPLIDQTYSRVPAIEWSFFNDRFFSYFHHKLFYPAYFLAIFLGIFMIWRHKSNLQTVFFMAFFLFYIFYAFKSQLAGSGHSMHLSKRWFFVPGTFLLAAGPALWLYARQYAQRPQPFTRSDALHFFPALLVILVSSFLFTGPSAWRANALYNSFDHYPAWAEQLTFLFSGAYYGWQTNGMIQRKKELHPEGTRWFKGLLTVHILFIALWGFMLSANFFLYDGMATSLEYHWIWLYTALFALAGTYLIIFRKELLFPPVNGKDHRLEPMAMNVLKEQLMVLMREEKPFLDPELSLQRLAHLLGIREKELSELLNTGLQTNFYHFLNTYRLEEVRKLLLDPEKQHLTNLAIAQEAGFSSRSTFFSAFKKQFGVTPGAFKKAHLNGQSY